jgi:hypothetical protein
MGHGQDGGRGRLVGLAAAAAATSSAAAATASVQRAVDAFLLRPLLRLPGEKNERPKPKGITGGVNVFFGTYCL